MKGTVIINNEIKHSNDLFTDVNTHVNNLLPVLDRNDVGDCLCYVEASNGVMEHIVDIDHQDIKLFVPAMDPLEQLKQALGL